MNKEWESLARKWLAFLLSMTVAALAGCSKPSSVPGKPDGSGDKANAGSGSKVKITMAVLSGGFKPAIEDAVKEFTQNTGIEVELIGLDIKGLFDKTFLELNSRSSTFDVVSFDGPYWLAQMHQHLEPLDEYVKKDNVDLKRFVSSYLEMGRYPSRFTARPADYKEGTGTVYGLPVREGVHILHYRKDVLEQNKISVPKSMKELKEAAKKITEASNKQVYGILLHGEQGSWIVSQYLDFLWNFGGDVFTKDYKQSALDSKEAMDALSFMVSLYQEGYSPPATPTYNMDKSVAALQQGLGAMYLEYSPRALVLNNSADSKTAGKWAWAPLPSIDGTKPGTGLITGWSIGVNKYGKNKDAAWKLIKHLTDEKVQLKMAVEKANGPTAVSVFNNPDYQKVFPPALEVLKAAETGYARAGIPQITEIEDIMAAELNAALIGKKTPETALKDAHKRINTLLK